MVQCFASSSEAHPDGKAVRWSGQGKPKPGSGAQIGKAISSSAAAASVASALRSEARVQGSRSKRPRCRVTVAELYGVDPRRSIQFSWFHRPRAIAVAWICSDSKTTDTSSFAAGFTGVPR